MSIEIVAELNM